MTAEQIVSRREREAAARKAFVRSPVVYPGGGHVPKSERPIDMTYAEAMALKAAGTSNRVHVLTELGWVRVQGGG